MCVINGQNGFSQLYRFEVCRHLECSAPSRLCPLRYLLQVLSQIIQNIVSDKETQCKKANNHNQSFAYYLIYRNVCISAFFIARTLAKYKHFSSNEIAHLINGYNVIKMDIHMQMSINMHQRNQIQIKYHIWHVYVSS